MKKAIHATLFHVASSANNNWHDHCPVDDSTWCKYNYDKVNLTSTYKPGAGLPRYIVEKLKPMYVDLSKDELLKKCLHGKTQNQNESFNGTIWERVPKTRYVGIEKLKFGVYDAIANFNIGRKASVLMFERMGMIPGRYASKGCSVQNRKRLYIANYKNKSSTKTRRKVISGKKKQKDDVNIETEGTQYLAGGF